MSLLAVAIGINLSRPSSYPGTAVAAFTGMRQIYGLVILAWGLLGDRECPCYRYRFTDDSRMSLGQYSCQTSMTVTELIPAIRGLSHTEQLLLLQVLVQELLKAEGLTGMAASTPLDTVTEKYVADTDTAPLTLAERQAFFKRPLAERQRLLAEQAEAMQKHYEQDADWQDLMVGDIIEY
jgi:hypothetical protein